MPATNFTHGVVVGADVKTANYSVSADDDAGRTIIANAADLVVTLPPTVAGFVVTVALGPSGLSAGTGLSVSPDAADAIHGNGFTAAVDKDAILDGATDRVGDSITLVGDGVDGWYITAISGTWSREA